MLMKHVKRKVFASGLTLVLLLIMAGCSGPQAATESNPDDEFGHRFEEPTPDGRSTVLIAPPAADVSYNYYPAIIEDIHVRQGDFDLDRPADEQEVPVEVLVKGSLPDACTELHSVEQERTGNLLRMTLQVRRPQGAVCASVVRPYRFYVELEGAYEQGPYTLRINDQVKAFTVAVATES